MVGYFNMFVLRPTFARYSFVCPTCAKRGQVISDCTDCHGRGTKIRKVMQYRVQDKPIQIIQIDRDPATGILRYWENQSDFYYETVDSSLNKFVPDVPHGIHLIHANAQFAKNELERVNAHLLVAQQNNTRSQLLSKFSI